MQIPLEQLYESPLNARKVFGDLKELGESLKKRQIQAITVRPGDGNKYEIIAGHRRFRAAKLVGLPELRADVQDFTDEEAAEAYLIENCRRQDLNPLEQAEGFKTLRDKYGRTVAEISKSSGWSPSYVQERLHLLCLPKKALDSLATGAMKVGVGLALAAVADAKLRTEAAAQVLEGIDDWEVQEDEDGRRQHVRKKRAYSEIEVRALLRKEYFLLIDDGCGFDPDDPDLVKGAASCTACTKHSKANLDLFKGFGTKNDYCFDKACFKKKQDAAWRLRKVAEESAGRKDKVLEGAAAAKIISPTGSLKGGYLRPDSRVWNDPKHRTVAQLLGKKGLEENKVTVRDDSGRVQDVVPPAVVEKARKAKAKEAGLPDEKEAKAKLKEKERKEREENDRKARIEEVTSTLTVGAIVAAFGKGDAIGRPWCQIVDLLLGVDLFSYVHIPLETAVRRGLYELKSEKKGGRGFDLGEDADRAADALRKALETMKEPEARGLALELLLEAEGAFRTWGKGVDLAKKLAKEFRVDLRPLKDQAKAAVEKELAAAGQGECLLEPGKPRTCKTCKETHCAGKKVSGGVGDEV